MELYPCAKVTGGAIRDLAVPGGYWFGAMVLGTAGAGRVAAWSRRNSVFQLSWAWMCSRSSCSVPNPHSLADQPPFAALPAPDPGYLCLTSIQQLDQTAHWAPAQHQIKRVQVVRGADWMDQLKASVKMNVILSGAPLAFSFFGSSSSELWSLWEPDMAKIGPKFRIFS